MNRKFVSWLLFILLCFIWGSSFFLMKVSNRGLTAEQLASLRIFSASIIFVPLAFYYYKLIPRQKRALTFLTGVFGNLIPAFCFAIGIVYLDSYLEGILNSLTPICVVIIGGLVFRDKIGTAKIVGVVVGFVGLCLLTMSRSSIRLDNLQYALLVIGGTVSYGLNINLVSHKLRDIPPLALTSVSLAGMCIPAFLVLWWQGFFNLDFQNEDVRWGIFNAVILGISASSIASFLFYWLVQREGGLFASLVTYGIPFVALFWGLIANEPVSWIEVLCLLLILSGVFLANKKTAKKESDAVAPLPDNELKEI